MENCPEENLIVFTQVTLICYQDPLQLKEQICCPILLFASAAVKDIDKDDDADYDYF